jgi:hypothetical protein
MKKHEYIAGIKAKNPKLFTAEKITLTPAALERVISQAFDAGKQEAEAGMDFFKGIFGGKR